MGSRRGVSQCLALAGCAVLGLAGCYNNHYRNDFTFTSAVAAADLDGDGRTDLLGASQADFGMDGFVTTRLQDPTRAGGFQGPVRSFAGANPSSLAVGSLSPGARPGAVVVNQQVVSMVNAANTVTVLLPAAQPGTFLDPVMLQLGPRNPFDAALGALTASGLSDIAVAADGGSDVLVFFQGPGPGAFSAPAHLAVGGVPSAVAIADLDGDGLRDLAVATSGNLVSVLLQDPAHPGTFLPHVDYSVGSNPASVKAAPLTGGLADLVVADFGTDLAPTTRGLSVLLHDPARPGAFLPAVTYDTGDFNAFSVAVGDLDGDGRPDVLVANFGTFQTRGSVALFLQDPASPGTFLSPTLYPGFNGPTSVAIGDFDSDGLPDFAVADGGVVIRYQIPGRPGVFGAAVGYRQ